ncbi:MAG: hypothetical protein ACI7YS_00750 [Flavobacterium sp.]
MLLFKFSAGRQFYTPKPARTQSPKTKLKKENYELVSATNQLKLPASDGKKRLSDMLYDGIIAPGKQRTANRYLMQ